MTAIHFPGPKNGRGNRQAWWAGAILLFAATLYWGVIQRPNEDLTAFQAWLDAIIANGRWHALSLDFSNYAPAYLYLLSIFSHASGHVPDIIIIKSLSILGTLFLCGAVHYCLVRFIDARSSLVAALAVLLIPSVILNAPVWGQCDAMYAAAMVAALGAGLRGRWAVMMILVGVGIAFKLQAIFMAPLFLILLLAGRIRWWMCPIPVAVYAVLMVPAWLAGRSLIALATIYLQQADTAALLSMNAPNIWFLVQKLHWVSDGGGMIAGLIAAVLLSLVLSALFVRRKMVSGHRLLEAAALCTIAIPYVLPRMHERYFFVADILTYILAVITRRRDYLIVFALTESASTLAASTFLFHFESGPPISAVLMTMSLVMMLKIAFERREGEGGSARAAQQQWR